MYPTRWSSIAALEKFALSRNCLSLPCRMHRAWPISRYEGGVDTLLNALVVDTSLFSAELSLAQTKRNELLSLVQLYKALGGGWQQ